MMGEAQEESTVLQNIQGFVRDKLRQAANPAPLLDPDHTRYPMVRFPACPARCLNTRPDSGSAYPF